MPQLKEDLRGGIFDALDIGLILLDSDRRIIAWNSWIAAASGISKTEAVGKELAELFPGLDLGRLNAAVAEALKSGTSSLLTHSLHPSLFPLKTRAGMELIHDVSLRTAGEKPFTNCLVQVTDVTVAVQRERVLRERQNARYGAVVDNAPDAILTIDAEGVVQFANPAARREFGCITEELVGRPAGTLFADRMLWDDVWLAAIKGAGLPHGFELTALRMDGSLNHVEMLASRWVSESRVFVTAILRNANERHEAEATLRRLNETLEERVATALAERKLLADIVENTDALVQVLDLDYRVLAINKASADKFDYIYGVRPKIGDDLHDLLREWPEELEIIKAGWKRALEGEAFTVVLSFGGFNLDRSAYELKFNALRDATGKQIAAFQFAYDVTERLERQAQLMRTEEALRQSQKMDAIGQLTGGIAHDFNNLLTGIIGGMDILKRRIASGSYDDTQRFMDAASASAYRAAALTHRLLAFARRQPLDPKGVDANQLVRSLEDLFRRTLGEQIKLSTDLQSDLWPTFSDANQLENALLNLVINARDAMPNGGRLVVETRNVVFESTFQQGAEEIEAGEYTVVSVADTGGGIPPEIVDRVFDPFFTTKPLGQGTGLGLSMIYGFAKQSRGHALIESEVGTGTKVSLYLPRYKGDLPMESPAELVDLAPGEGETVLLVEDDSSVRLLIGEVLRDLGYACMEAIDAQAALPMLISNARVDLMITDVGLPGLNGRQLSEIARQHRPDLKILFVTGYAEHAIKGTFLEPGMAMVTKPFALDSLALKIRDMLSPRQR
jgi:PAS domain S-box-containing protein